MKKARDYLSTDQHKELAVFVIILCRGLSSVGMNQYPKNCAVEQRRRRIQRRVESLKSKLEDVWYSVSRPLVSPITGIRRRDMGPIDSPYYGSKESNEKASEIISKNNNKSAGDFCRWLYDEILIKEIIERLDGYRPVKIIDAVLKIDLMLHPLGEQYDNTPMLRRYKDGDQT